MHRATIFSAALIVSCSGAVDADRPLEVAETEFQEIVLEGSLPMPEEELLARISPRFEPPVSAADIPAVERELEATLRDDGYLDVDVILAAEEGVLVGKVAPGPRYTFGNVEAAEEEGVSTPVGPLIHGMLTSHVRSGEPLLRLAIQDALAEIKSAYERAGFKHAVIVPYSTQDRERAVLHLSLRVTPG